MTMNPKPGNQPDSNDMSDAFGIDGDAGSPAAAHPDPIEEAAEEEAARLGDFA